MKLNTEKVCQIISNLHNICIIPILLLNNQGILSQNVADISPSSDIRLRTIYNKLEVWRGWRTHAPTNFRWCQWGAEHSRGSSVRRPGNKDPHRCQRKFSLSFSIKMGAIWYYFWDSQELLFQANWLQPVEQLRQATIFGSFLLFLHTITKTTEGVVIGI